MFRVLIRIPDRQQGEFDHSALWPSETPERSDGGPERKRGMSGRRGRKQSVRAHQFMFDVSSILALSDGARFGSITGDMRPARLRQFHKIFVSFFNAGQLLWVAHRAAVA
jgi:hypothetical protein